jgi:hypothetical protein
MFIECKDAYRLRKKTSNDATEAKDKAHPMTFRNARLPKLLPMGKNRGPTSAAVTLSSALCTFFAFGAFAKPPGQALFCQEYPAAPACSEAKAACTTCHTAPPALNAFGASVSAKLAVGATRPLADETYASGLPQALREVAALDADGDTFSNATEIAAGSDPADPKSTPTKTACAGNTEAGWNLCGYDPAYTYRKIVSDFCGRGATFEERATFATQKDSKAFLHATLNTCLTSEYWQGRDGVVWNIASPKIRPIQSIKSGKDGGPVPLADYYNDYALFVYAETGDRDARDLLRAQYLVSASENLPTTYTRFEATPIADAKARGASGETVEVSKRAGMISSSWFRTINTMFTSVPRTTAAQAYRSYLGFDIALLQGLQAPVAQTAAEPVDYDGKGVRAKGCISCHQTLDPLSYPFSRYEGIDADDKSLSSEAFFNSYRPDRMLRFVPAEGPKLLDVPEQGILFGKPVNDLVEWGKVASESDAFAQKTVLDFWRVLFGGDPTASETATYTKIWQRFRNENGYQVAKTLHDLIETEAYGAP